jgi:hypothetical protein
MKIIGSEIKRKSIKELLSFPPISQVYSSTALSPQEAIAAWILNKLKIFSRCEYGYIGNVGIKSYIPRELRPYVNESKDLDIALKNIECIPEEYEITEQPLIDKIKYTHQGIEIIYSPFYFFKISIPSFQIGQIQYEVIDIFTPKVGIGPIPLEEEDFRGIRYIGYLPVLPLSLLISSHINPAAFTSERLRRALIAAIYNPVEIDRIQQKLEKSEEKMEKLGRGYQYRKELGRVSRECFRVERRIVEKIISRNKSGERNVENAREICKLLEKLYERF